MNEENKEKILELIKEHDQKNPRPTYNKSEGIIGEKNSMPLAWAHHYKRSDYVTEKLKESGLDIPSGSLESFVDEATAKEGSPFHDERVGVAIDDTISGLGKESEKPKLTKEELGKEWGNRKSTNEESGKLDKKPSPLDYVIEKESTEMPSIYESDGGE